MATLRDGYYKGWWGHESAFNNGRQKLTDIIQENKLETLKGGVLELCKGDLEEMQQIEFPQEMNRVMNGYRGHGLKIRGTDELSPHEFKIYKLEEKNE